MKYRERPDGPVVDAAASAAAATASAAAATAAAVAAAVATAAAAAAPAVSVVFHFPDRPTDLPRYRPDGVQACATAATGVTSPGKEKGSGAGRAGRRPAIQTAARRCWRGSGHGRWRTTEGES